MFDSMRPCSWLPDPWDSPGKNTGVGCHFLLQCMKVKSESEVIQSCLTLCGPMDCSLPESSIHGIFQARVLEWVAIAFLDICLYMLHTYSCVCVNHSVVLDFTKTEHGPPALQAASLPSEPQGKPKQVFP